MGKKNRKGRRRNGGRRYVEPEPEPSEDEDHRIDRLHEQWCEEGSRAAAKYSYQASSGAHIQKQRDRTPKTQAELDALRTAAHARHQQNARQPIMRLPTEMLLCVFWELYSDITASTIWSDRRRLSREYYGPSRKSGPPPLGHWLLLTQVCRAWRNIALDCSSLWSHIPLYIGKQWAHTFLERSRAAPLSFSFGQRFSFSTPEWHASLFRAQLPRVRELEFSNVSPYDVGEYFDLIQTHIPEQLVRLTLQPRNPHPVKSKHLDVFLQMPQLRDLSLGNVFLPWSKLPWSNLRSLEVIFRRPNAFTADLKQLVTSLASTTALEEFRLKSRGCCLDPTTGASPAIAHLPRLRCIVYEGFATDFKQLSDAICIPTTAVLDIALFSDSRSAAEPTLLANLLHAHSGHVEGVSHHCIQSMWISEQSINSEQIHLRAWHANVDITSTDAPPALFNLYFHFPHSYNDRNFYSRIQVLCESIRLDCLVQLRMPVGGWSAKTWRSLFMQAHDLKYVHADGYCSEGFFHALSMAPDTDAFKATSQCSDDPQEQPHSLLPSLRHLQLTGFYFEIFIDEDEPGGEREFYPHNLFVWLEARAEHAPIKTLTLTKCSLPEGDELEQLEKIEGLRVDWDGRSRAADEESESSKASSVADSDDYVTAYGYGKDYGDKDGCEGCCGIGCFKCGKFGDYVFDHGYDTGPDEGSVYGD